MTEAVAFRSRVALFAALALASLGDPARSEPKPTSISYYYDALDQGVFRPISRSFDAALLVRRIQGKQREAANVDDSDDVRLPSGWWQPRLGHRAVSVEQLLHGPGPGGGPAPGKWKVVRAKTEGVSPGFQIKDTRGVRFAIKFDPPRYREMATGADVVTSYLLWGAGFNVPENTIAYFRPEDLELDPGATYTDDAGKKRSLSREFLEDILERVPRDVDGRYRVVASRFLSGKPLGEWEYRGRRKDDPEDLIPHQHRREIRGMYTIDAWLNHTDCSARNNLDMWVTEGGRSFVRHHLIDFSGCMGSASIAAQSPRGGSEYLLDYGTVAINLVTLGLKPPRWENFEDPGLPSIGMIDSRTFDPADWRPFLPNPAFDERTERDIRWGARIVAGFSDDHIRAAVAQGKYTDPRAAEYLTRILIERRDKIARRWLGESSATKATR